MLCPYAEFAIGWNQSIFDTGYDTESTIAVLALLLALAFALASLLIRFPATPTDKERLAAPIVSLRLALDFISTFSEIFSPPLSLRI